jgi:hypothetical protein
MTGSDEEATSTATPPVTPEEPSSGELITTLPAAAMRQLTLSSSSPDASADMNPDLASAFELWREESKSRQVYKYKEWKELCLAHVKASKEQQPASSWAHLSSSAWWRCRGQLAVWNALPKAGQPPKAIAALPPGTVLQACALYEWRPCRDEAPRCLVPPAASAEPTVCPWNLQADQRGQVWIVQITAPVVGYCVYSLDGYPFLLPGDVDDIGLEAWAQPSHWYWKVTCPAGAFLREGLELSTRRVSTLPYGTLVQVLRQCVNEAGLPRLQIVAHIYENESAAYRRVEGWCSTALNPLSGQRGKILQPFPLVRPAVYRIILPQGAVIRADVELGSPVVGHCPYGSWVSVNEQQFSDFPAERAVARLRLVGGGWISTRLNHAPPHDLAVVEFVGADQGFDPEKPELFHYHAQRQAVLLQREAESDETQPDQAMVDSASPTNASAAASSRIVATPPSSSVSATSALTPHSPGAAASYRRMSVMESNANILSKPCLCCGKSMPVVIQCQVHDLFLTLAWLIP